jgi:Ca2+-binding protein (EF-Hand superfamily)
MTPLSRGHKVSLNSTSSLTLGLSNLIGWFLKISENQIAQTEIKTQTDYSFRGPKKFLPSIPNIISVLFPVMRKAFQMFDTAKTGFIDTLKISTILNTMGQLFDDTELQALIDENDPDGKSDAVLVGPWFDSP